MGSQGTRGPLDHSLGVGGWVREGAQDLAGCHLQPGFQLLLNNLPREGTWFLFCLGRDKYKRSVSILVGVIK